MCRKHLDDGRALVGEHPLELAQVPVAQVALLVAHGADEPCGEDVLVVGPVEHTEVPAGRAHGVDPPEIVVRELRRRSAP